MSDEQLKAENNGGAFDDGGGAADGAAADVDAAAAEGEDDGEAQAFAELSALRAAGTRFDAMSKDDEGKADGGGAGKADGKPGDGEGAPADGKPGEGAADGKPGEGEGAPADGKPGEGAADGKPGEGAAAGGTDLTGDVAGLRDLLVEEMGDLEVAAAEDGDPAVTFKDLAKDYPAITTAMVAIVARLTAPLRAQYEAQQYAAGRERILGEIEAELPGARALADSSEFAAWYGAQPAGVQQLGQSPAASDACKLLKLYLAENPQAARRAAGPGSGDEMKRRRLAVLAAGSGGGSGAAPRGGRAIERAGVSEFVDEDEAEAEFERLAAERRAKAAQ